MDNIYHKRHQLQSKYPQEDHIDSLIQKCKTIFREKLPMSRVSMIFPYPTDNHIILAALRTYHRELLSDDEGD